MNAEERLKAAGWKRLHQPCDLTMYRWTRDGIDWYTEDEALVVVLTAERDAAIARAEAAEALAASRLEATEESEATLRGLLIGAHFYVQGGEYGDETFPRAEDARARAAELLTIERNRDVDNCVAWGVMITLGEEDAMGTAIEDADLDAVPALRAHAAKVSR